MWRSYLACHTTLLLAVLLLPAAADELDPVRQIDSAACRHAADPYSCDKRMAETKLRVGIIGAGADRGC